VTVHASAAAGAVVVTLCALFVALAPTPTDESPRVLTPAHGSDERLGSYQADVELAADGETVAWSEYDPPTGEFRLMLRERGAVRRAPVAPRRVAFDVDVGRTTGGRSLVVYSRCKRESARRTSGCDLYAFDPAVDQEREIVVRPRAAEDSRPVVSAGRIVFVRSRGDLHAFYAASVAGGRVTRVTLPEMSSRDRLYGGGLMDLSGRRLAYVLSKRGQPQVHLQHLDGSRVRHVARLSPGESGSAFVGLNFDGDTLTFARAFYGDWRGPGTAFRYRARRLDYAAVPRGLTDFAVGAGRAFWVDAPETCFLRATTDEPSCYFVEGAGTLRFKRWDRGWGGPWAATASRRPGHPVASGRERTDAQFRATLLVEGDRTAEPRSVDAEPDRA
jgi:hypothetical protein